MCRWALDDEKLQQQKNDQQKTKNISIKDQLKLILLKQSKKKPINKAREQLESKKDDNNLLLTKMGPMKHPYILDRSFEKLYQKFI